MGNLIRKLQDLCDLITWPWPHKLLTLPFAIRLGMCLLCFPLCMVIYLLTYNGIILTIPMGLASWLFQKRGACATFFSFIAVEVAYNSSMFGYALWAPERTYSFIGAILVLFLEGSAVVSLRHLLDKEEETRQKAEQGEQQLKIAYEQQRQLNRLKNQFILNVNHELRTPLAAAYGYLELLYCLLQERGQLDKESHAGYLKNALDYCEELRVLVNNVLDTMAIGSDKGQLQLETLPVIKVINEVLTQFNASQRQEHRIQIDVPRHLVVHANRQCIRHVLYNLLSNAFKYSPEGSLVVISASESNSDAATGQTCICIQDQGPGIALEEIPLLFGQFVRLPRNLGGTIRGTGLGLYISKHLVEAMGGKIWVESEGIAGKGSRFYFTLPGAKPLDVNEFSLIT